MVNDIITNAEEQLNKFDKIVKIGIQIFFYLCITGVVIYSVYRIFN